MQSNRRFLVNILEIPIIQPRVAEREDKPECSARSAKCGHASRRGGRIPRSARCFLPCVSARRLPNGWRGVPRETLPACPLRGEKPLCFTWNKHVNPPPSTASPEMSEKRCVSRGTSATNHFLDRETLPKCQKTLRFTWNKAAPPSRRPNHSNRRSAVFCTDGRGDPSFCELTRPNARKAVFHVKQRPSYDQKGARRGKGRKRRPCRSS